MHVCTAECIGICRSAEPDGVAVWARARAGWRVQDKEYTDEGYDSDSTRVVDSAKLAEPELLTWIFNSDLAQV